MSKKMGTPPPRQRGLGVGSRLCIQPSASVTCLAALFSQLGVGVTDCMETSGSACAHRCTGRSTVWLITCRQAISLPRTHSSPRGSKRLRPPPDWGDTGRPVTPTDPVRHRMAHTSMPMKWLRAMTTIISMECNG